ncbi:MAG: mechanosensitive ion channel family protein [Candidatus Levyibacteriota bacterium]
MPNIANTLVQSLNQGLFTAASFIPNLVSGLIIFLIGILLASLVKRLIIEVLNALKIEQYLKRYDIPEAKKDFSWTNILAEIARWFVIILFLIPTADVWGLPQVTTVLNTFLLYLPNVFVAAIIGLIGMALAKLASELVRASARRFSQDVSRSLATTVRIAITIFVFLAVLNQLGVAQDLIRILFTGFVAMIAIAGGIAFGLGGKDFAHALLEKLQKKLK